jgi:two-component system chemotaxis response regulator CheB
MEFNNCLNIQVGQLKVSSTPTVLTTTVSQSVAVCIYSVNGSAGGITHYSLPSKSLSKMSMQHDLNYGESSIKLLVSALLKLPGVLNKDLRAKIVGGAKSKTDHASNIAEQNISKAHEILNLLQISIVGEDCGGSLERKIFFYSDTGRLRVSATGPVKAEMIFTTSTSEDRPKVLQKVAKKKVLIIDDSKPIRNILTKILESDEIEIIGTAASAAEALPMIKTLRPDVITLDIHMEGKDGVTFLKEYLPIFPIPTIMISSISMQESNHVLNSLEIGAVDYIEKPTIQEIVSKKGLFQEKVLIASKIRVRTSKSPTAKSSLSQFNAVNDIIVIGSSTGGTEALKHLLLGLPSNIPPIVIVQHIPPVFSAAFANRLNELCNFEVKEAADGDEVRAGRVLIAPGGKQLKVIRDKMGHLLAHVYDGDPVNRHKPSVDVLFESAVPLLGKASMAIILTGMGNDGAKGMLKLKQAGAFTIAQDEASCVVFGMPKVAIELGGVDLITDLSSIAENMVKHVNQKKSA